MTDQEKKDFLAEESLIAEKAHLKYEALIMGIAAKFKELHPDAVVTHVTTVNHAEPVFNNDPCTECKEPIGLNRVIVARTGEQFCCPRCRNLDYQHHRQKDPHYTTKTKGDGLTEEKVVEVKRMIYAGYTDPEVVEKTCVPRSTVVSIRTGRTWTDVRVPKEEMLEKAPARKRKSKFSHTQIQGIKDLLKAGKLTQTQIANKMLVSVYFVHQIKAGKIHKDPIEEPRITVGFKPFMHEILPEKHPDILETGVPVTTMPFRCHHCDCIMAGKIFEDAEGRSFCNHTCYRAYVNSDQFRKDSGLDDFHVKLKRLAVNNEKADRAVRPEINR